MANSADPDQTAPDQGLHCLQFPRSASFGCITLRKSHCIFWMHYSKEKPFCSTFRVITANFRVSEILGFLWY